MDLNHLALIMDGNRRWANLNKLPTYEGHRRGATNLWNIIKETENYKIKFSRITKQKYDLTKYVKIRKGKKESEDI